jgi:RNA polymerase-binding transcription factor DksA
LRAALFVEVKKNMNMATTVRTNNLAAMQAHVWALLSAERQDVCKALNAGTEPLSQRRLRLNLIDSAMDRLIDGNYGLCAKCSAAIEQKSLYMDPALTACYDCRQEARSL